MQDMVKRKKYLWRSTGTESEIEADNFKLDPEKPKIQKLEMKRLENFQCGQCLHELHISFITYIKYIYQKKKKKPNTQKTIEMCFMKEKPFTRKA